jgi:diguanylate cyclase (GGDEF)-like protein/PAS domain S-box-containing protein
MSASSGEDGREDSVAAEETWFRTLFESSPDPAWIIEDHRFVECNAAAIAALGYDSKDEFLDTHPSELSPSRQPDGEDSYAKAERLLAITQEKGQHRFEWLHQRADGSHFVAEVTLSLIAFRGRQVMYCAWRDITDRKEAEAGLLLARSIMESTSEGVLVTDEKGLIISVNPAFSKITGYTAEEAIGQKPSLLKSDHHDEAFYRQLWQAVLKDGRWEGEIWNRRKSGEMYPEWLTINRIPAVDGIPVRYASVFHDITEQRQANARIQYLAFHDALTGLPNRALFQDRLVHAVDRARREGKRLSVTFIDLDGFKEINDSLGHDVGDLLLQEVAQRIRTRLRRGADTVARLGGDEFVVLMEDLKDVEHCACLAGEIIEDLAAPFQLRDHPVRVGASVGMAFFPEDGGEALELMKHADTAMYAAKASGKGVYRFFQPEMLENLNQRIKLETDLRHAIERGALELHYQPKICVTDGKLRGVEALVRWPHPEHGLVMPQDFIPIAEETGLIVSLGNWVLAEACRQAAAWRNRGLDITVAVNVSARQIAKDRLVDRVAGLLAEHGLPASALQIELTETALLTAPELATETLDRLREMGVVIAIDDFGTGYSSLARMRRLPIDLVKIDRSFIENMDNDAKDAEVVRTIVALAKALGLDIIAEGVESQRQSQILHDSGCTVCQGYYFARPKSVAQLESWLAEDGGRA